MLWSFSSIWLLEQLAIASILYTISLYIYRVYFHPLSRFPGPKLAAATLFYEGYYDLVKDGRWPWKIHDLHRKYGPIVRINPREIHIQDPEYVDQLYQRRLDRDPWFSKAFGAPLAISTTSQHDLHRLRRGALNPFFSKQSINSRVEVVQAKVHQFCERLKSMADAEEIIHIDAGFICLTLDIITQFCYGTSYNYLDVPGFDKNSKKMVEIFAGSGGFNRQFPWIFTLMNSLPVWVTVRMAPKLAGIFHLQSMIRIHVKRILESHHKTTLEPSEPERKPTIFAQILDSKLPPSEKSEDRLLQEGQVLIAAGSETTARVLYLSCVHLLKRPTILSRVRAELQTVMPSPDSQPTLQQLEHLPFLTATIKEAIRLSGSIVTRTPRMSPAHEPLVYKGMVIPPGTPVSLTLHDVLMDERIFPEPERFDPMRWLTRDDGSEGGGLKPNMELERYFVAFSRGPRTCVGIWLAWAELYLTIANVYRKFEMELYETEEEDVKSACDRFTCFAKPGNRGVRVRITGLRE